MTTASGFFNALLPLATFAADQCRKAAERTTGPAAQPVAKLPKRKHARDTEAEALPALGEEITRVPVAALRREERSLLTVIREHGPLTMAKLAKLSCQTPSARKRVLEDLDRFGLIASYFGESGSVVVHVTDKPEPPDEWDATLHRPRKLEALPK